MKSIILVPLLLVAACATPIQMKKPDRTVLGIPLGEKFAVPECARGIDQARLDQIASVKKLQESEKRLGLDPHLQEQLAEQTEWDEQDARKERYVAQRPSSPCFEWPYLDVFTEKQQREYLSANAPVKTAELKIILPSKRTPGILSGSIADAQIIDGNLESIWFPTFGLKDQNITLATLQDKYGKPTKLIEENKQNASGGVFLSHYAEWDFSDLTVIFRGMADSTDAGSVRIDTDKGHAFARAAEAKSQHDPNL